MNKRKKDEKWTARIAANADLCGRFYVLALCDLAPPDCIIVFNAWRDMYLAPPLELAPGYLAERLHCTLTRFLDDANADGKASLAAWCEGLLAACDPWADEIVVTPSGPPEAPKTMPLD